jgi:hypothetical protein
MINAYRMLVGNFQGKKPLKRIKRMLTGNKSKYMEQERGVDSSGPE